MKVTLDNKAKDKLSIVWNTDVYKADKAGTYKLTGTLQTKEGITIPEEFRKVTVNVTVEEKGKFLRHPAKRKERTIPVRYRQATIRTYGFRSRVLWLQSPLWRQFLLSKIKRKNKNKNKNKVFII